MTSTQEPTQWRLSLTILGSDYPAHTSAGPRVQFVDYFELRNWFCYQRLKELYIFMTQISLQNGKQKLVVPIYFRIRTYKFCFRIFDSEDLKFTMIELVQQL